MRRNDLASGGADFGGSGLNWDRVGVLVSIGLAAAAGAYALIQTEDRYYASQAAADSALVSQRIDYAEREIEQLRADIRALDDRHPPESLLLRLERLEREHE